MTRLWLDLPWWYKDIRVDCHYANLFFIIEYLKIGYKLLVKEVKAITFHQEAN
jgi:hypothetical protein